MSLQQFKAFRGIFLYPWLQFQCLFLMKLCLQEEGECLVKFNCQVKAKSFCSLRVLLMICVYQALLKACHLWQWKDWCFKESHSMHILLCRKIKEPLMWLPKESAFLSKELHFKTLQLSWLWSQTAQEHYQSTMTLIILETSIKYRL